MAVRSDHDRAGRAPRDRCRAVGALLRPATALAAALLLAALGGCLDWDAIERDPAIGCADGVADLAAAAGAAIAACDGAFRHEGLADVAAGCRNSGDDGDHRDGLGCAAADLCAPGWHVCRDHGEVAAREGGAELCDALEADLTRFYATAQSSPGAIVGCEGPSASDDPPLNGVYGCGALVDLVDAEIQARPADPDCAPLRRHLEVAACPAPWKCGLDEDREAKNTRKPDLGGGGVLCCADP